METSETPRNPSMRVPVNIIAGGLGAGKTTAINRWLAQRPDGERWAVLVNEYGQVGVDAALLEGGEDPSLVTVREVAGGCICCTAGIFFDMALVTLLGLRPDRLLIEPTGLASLSGILQSLERPGIVEVVDLRTTFALVDASRWPEMSDIPEEQDRWDHADTIVVTHTEEATVAQRALLAHHAARQPGRPTRVVTEASAFNTLDGLDRIAGRVLDRPAGEWATTGHKVMDGSTTGQGDPHVEPAGPGHTAPASHAHAHPSASAGTGPGKEHHRKMCMMLHRSGHAVTVGWELPEDRVLDEARLRTWVAAVWAETRPLRLKAVLRTESGTWSWNLSAGTESAKPSRWTGPSKMEIVYPPETDVDFEAMDRSLRFDA